MKFCETCHRPMSSLGCGFDGHTQEKKLALTPTPDNINNLLWDIGCRGRSSRPDPVPDMNRGWSRVYIVTGTKTEEGDVQIGRVMFKDGVFQWVNWYRTPDGALNETDKYWFSWSLLLGTRRPLGTDEWELLKALAEGRSSSDLRNKRNRRFHLNMARVELGKRRRTGAVSSNPARTAMKIVEEAIYEAGGRYHG